MLLKTFKLTKFLSSLYTAVCLFLAALLLSCLSQARDTCQILVAGDLSKAAMVALESSSHQDPLDLSEMPSTSLMQNESLKKTLGQYDFVVVQDAEDSFGIFFTAVDPLKSNQWLPLKTAVTGFSQFAELINCKMLNRRKRSTLSSRKAAKSLHRRFHKKPRLGEMALGEALLRLEYYFLKNTSGTDINFSETLKKYRALVGETSNIAKNIQSPNRLFKEWVSVLAAAYSDEGANVNYCAESTMMIEALARGCTNCMGETLLFLSLFSDSEFKAPTGWDLSVEMFSDHIRPILYNEESGKIFDLAYGKIQNRRGAIYPWIEYIPAVLYQLKEVVHPVETQSYEGSHQRVSYKPWACLGSFSNKTPARVQMPIVSGYYACGNFSPDEPPEGEVDNSSRIQPLDSESNKDGDQKGSGILGNALNTAKNLLGKAGDHFGRRRHFRDRFAVEMFFKYKKTFVESDKIVIDNFEEKSISREQFIGHFNRPRLLSKLGVVETEDKEMNLFLARVNKADECRILPPLIPLLDQKDRAIHKSRSEFEIEISDQALFQQLRALPNEDRYFHYIQWLENEIEKGLPLLAQAFDRDNLAESLISQSNHYETIRMLDNLIVAYFEVYQRISFCIDDFFNTSSTYSPILQSFSLIPYYSEKIQSIVTYQRKISTQPMAFLKAIMAAQDQLSEIVVTPMPSGLDSFMSMDLLALDSDKLQRPGFFYQDFVDFFLLNKEYFFAPPETERDETFGKVRPFVPIKIQQYLESQKKEHNYVEVNLPKLGFQCEKGDFGYQPRGLFYIYCGAEDSNSAFSQLEQGHRDKIGNSKMNQKGLDDEGITRAVVDDKFKELQKSKKTNKVIPSGNPDSRNYVNSFPESTDPRQEVLIDVKYWPTLLNILRETVDHGIYSASLHHLQRSTIEDYMLAYYNGLDRFPSPNGLSRNIFASKPQDLVKFDRRVLGQFTGLGDTRININYVTPGTNKVSKQDFISTLASDGSAEEKLAVLLEKFHLRKTEELNTRIPRPFNDNHFRKAIFLEMENKLKRGWSWNESPSSRFRDQEAFWFHRSFLLEPRVGQKDWLNSDHRTDDVIFHESVEPAAFFKQSIEAY